MNEWSSLSEWVSALNQGTVSSRELVQFSIQRIERFNPMLNAVVEFQAERALKEAEEADRRRSRGEPLSSLDGIPITIKDLFEVEGFRTTCGYKPLAKYRSKEDAHVVSRLRKAGAIIIGKTNVPILGLDFQCDNPVYGRTVNPWDPERTPGGSSGGSASAVAAGLIPLDIGSDIGGSIRIPAHYCGIFGFKPTDSRVSTRGHIPSIPSIVPATRVMLSIGPLARTMIDIMLVSPYLFEEDPHRPDIPPMPLTSVDPSREKPLRIAWTIQFGSYPVSGDVQRVFHEFLSRCEAAGHLLQEVIPERWGLDFDRIWSTWGYLAGAQLGCTLPWAIRQVLRLQFIRMKCGFPASKSIFRGGGLNLKGFMKALADRDELHDKIDSILREFDVWITPVSMTPAIRHTKPGKMIEIDGKAQPYLAVGTAYTTPFNLFGTPIVVMPVGFSSESLPVGVQIIGRRWRDEKLLRDAYQLSGLAVVAHPPEFSENGP